MNNYVITDRKLMMSKAGELELQLVVASKSENILLSTGTPLTEVFKTLLRGDIDNLAGAIVVVQKNEDGLARVHNPIDSEVFFDANILDASQKES